MYSENGYNIRKGVEKMKASSLLKKPIVWIVSAILVIGIGITVWFVAGGMQSIQNSNAVDTYPDDPMLWKEATSSACSAHVDHPNETDKNGHVVLYMPERIVQPIWNGHDRVYERHDDTSFTYDDGFSSKVVTLTQEQIVELNDLYRTIVEFDNKSTVDDDNKTTRLYHNGHYHTFADYKNTQDELEHYINLFWWYYQGGEYDWKLVESEEPNDEISYYSFDDIPFTTEHYAALYIRGGFVNNEPTSINTVQDVIRLAKKELRVDYPGGIYVSRDEEKDMWCVNFTLNYSMTDVLDDYHDEQTVFMDGRGVTRMIMYDPHGMRFGMRYQGGTPWNDTFELEYNMESGLPNGYRFCDLVHVSNLSITPEIYGVNETVLAAFEQKDWNFLSSETRYFDLANKQVSPVYTGVIWETEEHVMRVMHDDRGWRVVMNGFFDPTDVFSETVLEDASTTEDCIAYFEEVFEGDKEETQNVVAIKVTYLTKDRTEKQVTVPLY